MYYLGERVCVTKWMNRRINSTQIQPYWIDLMVLSDQFPIFAGSQIETPGKC